MSLSKVKPRGRCKLCKKDIHCGTGLHKFGCKNLSISCWDTCPFDICKYSRVRFILSNIKCTVSPGKALLPSWKYSMLLYEFTADGLTQLFCILLSQGTLVNINSFNGCNTLSWLIQVKNSELQINPEPALILFAVGESLQKQHLTAFPIPQCITQRSNEFTLQNMCKKAIRKHLLGIDFHVHLFNRIDQLGLPAPVRSYLFSIH